MVWVGIQFLSRETTTKRFVPAGDVRSRALPTFTTLLHSIAPPISSHEQLRIHITHDLENYPFVDNVVYGVFDRVMQQVEGGDLLVVQRGGGSKPRSQLDAGFSGGPWWKGMEKVCVSNFFCFLKKRAKFGS